MGRGRQAHPFHAIVVGSAISGGWAVKELTEKGLDTLFLERGRDLKRGEYLVATLKAWQRSTRGKHTPEFLR